MLVTNQQKINIYHKTLPVFFFFFLYKHTYKQKWARYSIFELIDMYTRYLKIELIDTRYFEEVFNRYSYRRYKYLDTTSGKKTIKKFGLQMNVCALRTIAKRKNYTYFYIFCCLFILLSRKSDQCAIRARLGVASHLSTTPRWENPAKCLSQWYK